MSLLSDIPFFDYETFSNTRQKINAILGEYKHCDHRVENARSVDMQYRLMQQGIGAVLTSDLHVRDRIFDNEDIVYLAPDSDEATRVLYFVINKDKQVTPALERFIEVARELFS
jgi:DNA-binding transcriptional LysR family regulator